MIPRIFFGGALFVRLVAPVAAVPQFIGRDELCTATVTVYPSIDGSDTSPPTTTLASTDGADSAPVVKTVTVLDTTTLILTVYASAGPGEQQTTDSPNASGPRTATVTVTVTNVLTSVETRTVVQTKTITQHSTILQTLTLTRTQTQTVTQTLAQANNVQHSVNGALALPSAPPAADADGLGELRPTSISALLPIAPQATSPPYYGNVTSSTTTATAATATGSFSYSNASTASTYQNGLYFTNWGTYANYQPQSLPASDITRLYYAFADIGSDGTVKTSDDWADTGKHYPTDTWNEPNSSSNAYGCVKQLYILKQANRGMKILLSIGGWTYSSKFSPVAADATARQTFVTSAVKMVTDYGFDGIDIDWEFGAYYPSGDDVTAADTANVVVLLQALRAGLDDWAAAHAPGYHFLLTVAAPAGPQWYAKWDMAAMDAYVDTWNLMTYDYAGAWGATSGHASNVYPLPANVAATPYNTEEAVSAYLAAGIAPAKLSLGLPLYGRSFDGTAALGAAYASVGDGDSLGTGQWRYKDLPRAGATEVYDDVAVATYSYDSASQELISYDNVQSVTEKTKYLRSKGLGGAMFWEASSDKNGTESLVVAMAGLLGVLDTSQNLLDYPTSQYANIRSGTP